MDRPIDVRGRAIRRVLLAVARRCADRGVRMPSHLRLGLALGISASQVTRHMARLRRDGFMETQQVGRRCYAVVGRIAA